MTTGYYDTLLDLEHLDPTAPTSSRAGRDCEMVALIAALWCAQRCDLATQLARSGTLAADLAEKILAADTAKSAIYAGFPIMDGDLACLSPRALATRELLVWQPNSRRKIRSDLAVEVPVRRDWTRRRIDPRNAASVLRFYKTTESYIWELMAANHLAETLFNYQVAIERLRRLGVRALLDYGAGIGSFALAATGAGIVATHMDLPSPSLAFAEWRYRIRGRTVPLLRANGTHLDIPPSDVIVCTEVVEHVTHPLKLLDALASSVPSSGYVAISESCADVEKFASHLPQNAWLGGARFIREMERRGFRYLPRTPETKILLFERTSRRRFPTRGS